MSAGTNNALTTVASKSTAIAIPRPNALIIVTSLVTKAPATNTKIPAALVIILPVRSGPNATLFVLSPVSS